MTSSVVGNARLRDLGKDCDCGKCISGVSKVQPALSIDLEKKLPYGEEASALSKNCNIAKTIYTLPNCGLIPPMTKTLTLIFFNAFDWKALIKEYSHL